MKEQMKILIGYDGSPCADAALDDLRRAGLSREAQAIVLTVFERWLPHAAGNNLSHTTTRSSPQASSNTCDVCRGRGRITTETRPCAQREESIAAAFS
jgi:nucleotide-binding universal stress UspA family protein